MYFEKFNKICRHRDDSLVSLVDSIEKKLENGYGQVRMKVVQVVIVTQTRNQ